MIKLDLTIEADHWVEMKKLTFIIQQIFMCIYCFKYCSRHQE